MGPSLLQKWRHAGGAAWRARLALPLMLAALLATGCSLFKPRDPQRPTTTSVRCRTRSAPDSLAGIIQDAYGGPSAVTCYIDILDAGFAFHPDRTDSIEDSDPSIYANWNRDVEARVATNLAADAGFCAAILDSEYAARSVSSDQRTEIRFYAYHLNFQTRNTATVIRYQGLADLTLVQGSDALWHVAVWIDRRDGSGKPTWGRLRRNYRVGF